MATTTQAATLVAPTPWTFSELTRQQFSPFRGLDNAIRAQQIGALEYIQQMASLSQTDISDWDLLDIFKQPDQRPGQTPLVLTDRSAINRKLFEQAVLIDTQKKRDVPDELAKVDRAVLMAASKQQGHVLDQRKQQIREQIAQYRIEINSRITRIEEYSTAVRGQMLELAKLEDRGLPNLADEVVKVLSGTFWELKEKPTAASQNLHFATRTPIVLSHKNERAGIDIRVLMGRYIVSYDMRTGNLKVSPYDATNVMIGDSFPGAYPHPYVNGAGGICWGNASHTAQNLLNNMQLADAMELLQGLLSTYSPDSTPYMELRHFHQRVQDLAGRNAPVTIPDLNPVTGTPTVEQPCVVCESTSGTCGCSFCESCDIWSAEGSTCGGNFCEHCAECYGPDETCDQHTCSVCGNMSQDTSECCCTECEEDTDSCSCNN